jgi:protein transport protein YIF1
MTLAVEVILIKLGCYLLGIGSEIHFLDFCSYSGYKFCILIVCLAAGIFGKMIKYCVFAYSILAYGFFLVTTFS